MKTFLIILFPAIVIFSYLNYEKMQGITHTTSGEGLMNSHPLLWLLSILLYVAIVIKVKVEQYKIGQAL